MATSKKLGTQLKYRIPRLKLCLVREGAHRLPLQPIKCPSDAIAILSPLRLAPEEHFVSLHLNARHEVIGIHEVSHGTISSSLVHPREVFKAALLSNSYAILVCHNHPSGSRLCPSKEDVETTEQLLKAGAVMGISVIDHLILGAAEEAYSLRENHPELWKSHGAVI